MGEAIMESRHPVLRLHKKDNVVVALRDLSPGEFIEEERVQVMEAIPKGHKVATDPLPGPPSSPNALPHSSHNAYKTTQSMFFTIPNTL